jgi:hypothetical protein
VVTNGHGSGILHGGEVGTRLAKSTRDRNHTPDVLMMKRESNWKVMEYTSELELFPEMLEGVEDALGQLIPLGKI